ncbi:MAG: fused MFS/spermidine synthase [Planctomycetota bacterium]|nr:fused MFS/spermidine synthase [Planctomycetota bacterium]
MSLRALLLYTIFFCSGASALTFETLWFRQAGLALGNSVWAGSMVLAAFMAGLALGNWITARFGDRVRSPIRAYGLLEFLIGASGLTLVLIFPFLNQWLVPVFQPFVDRPWALNSLRLVIGFGLLLLPTAAMGATLPLMVRGLEIIGSEFSERLGRLYAINTLGAMAGALCCELLLIEHLGIRGTGYAAAGVNGIAGLVAFVLGRAAAPSSEKPSVAPETTPAVAAQLSGHSRRILAAAFLSGCSLLALEVVWFRFFLLFNFGTSRVFAFMLAIVLAGIAIGGLLASRFFKTPQAIRRLPFLALGGGLFALLSFLIPALLIIRDSADFPINLSLQWSTLWQSIAVMLPVSVISGILFPLMGTAIRQDKSSDTSAVGALTLFNTTGAMCGAMLAGFLLLPGLGMQWSFAVIGLTYGVVALLCIHRFAEYTRIARVAFVGFALALTCTALIDSGRLLTAGVFLKVADKVDRHSTVVALREGVTSSIIYTETQYLGQPLSHRLITNGHSMSGTNAASLQYMKQYVYLPVAIHPNPRKALLISYGCGITAKALTDTKEFTEIDFVDISRDIVQLNRVVYPDSSDLPVNDPRVTVTIEDGRFFLQTRDKLYDVITSEPPPPTGAGIVTLYSKEYFQLIHDRLSPGGMTTYWLPHHSVSQDGSRAILQAFCDVFPDCSMWFGGGQNWLLLGIRDGHVKVSEQEFRRQWGDSRAVELAESGFEIPEQMASYFICDRTGMLEMASGCDPVVDNFPNRILPSSHADRESRYAEYIDADASQKVFSESEHIKRLWPDSLIDPSLRYFRHRNLIHDILATRTGAVSPERVGSVAVIHKLLAESNLQTPVLWSLGSSRRKQQIADFVEKDRPNHIEVLLSHGHKQMAARNYSAAIEQYTIGLSKFKTMNTQASHWITLRQALAYSMSGQTADAQRVLATLDGVSLAAQEQEDLDYLIEKFDIKRPSGVRVTASAPAGSGEAVP